MNVYIVRSHNKSNLPDGREVVFTGTPEECDHWYNDLPPISRVENRYLFGDDRDDAVLYMEWSHAGCSDSPAGVPSAGPLRPDWRK